MSAVIFVISASTFLVLLYLFMSSWFIWVLIVFFCLGAVEVSVFLIDFTCAIQILQTYLLCIVFLIRGCILV